MAKISTILQCFVDLNLETDEDSRFSLVLPTVRFALPSYNVNEGGTVNINVILSAPSVSGFEEVEVGIVPKSADSLDFDTLGESYPRILTFSAGQQTQTISFLANNDFLEEATESFDVILGSFTNVKPGAFITTKVSIGDQTNLKEVFINSEGASIPGVVVVGNTGGLGVVSTGSGVEGSGLLSSGSLGLLSAGSTPIKFSAQEGTSKDIKISLDSPSDFGVEKVTVLFTNNTTSSNDYSIVGSTNLSWGIGEQDKTITIQAINDELVENTEILDIELTNPINANLLNPFKAEFSIYDNSAEVRYININLQGLYTQVGGFNFQNVTELRHAIDNQELSTSSGDETMLLRFGDKLRTIIPNYYNGGASECGDNCIRTVVDGGLFGSDVTTDTIFFGENPVTGAHGDVRLKVINRGSFPIVIDGNQINTSESVTFDVDAFDYNLTLPTNNTLLVGGSILAGNIIPEDTLSEALYEFVLETDYAERSFSLKDFNNISTTTKEVSLGVHTFKETYTLANATVASNQHNLTTTYNTVLANWDNYPAYNSPLTCVPASAYASGTRSFPSNNPEAISITNGVGTARINGFIALSDNNIHYSNGDGHGPSGYDESTYVSVDFLPSGQTINSNCPPITFPGTSQKIAWTSLEFEIIP